VEEDNAGAIISDFEQDYPSLYDSSKAENKKKKQVNKVKSVSFNSTRMRTRAQKGSSKAALEATE